MKKIQLEVAHISPSFAHTNSFALLLAEKKGRRRLPVVIGACEAQAIAIGLENIEQPRPQTHDLIKAIFNHLGVLLNEVVISNLIDGVFHARLVCEMNGDIFEIDSRTSDAVALAVRFNAPIYTYEFIMEQAGVILEGATGTETSAKEKESETREKLVVTDFSKLSTKELKELLEKFLENEDYEKAARVRDELNRRKA